MLAYSPSAGFDKKKFIYSDGIPLLVEEFFLRKFNRSVLEKQACLPVTCR